MNTQTVWSDTVGFEYLYESSGVSAIRSCYFSGSYAMRGSINQATYGWYPGACMDIGQDYIFSGTFMTWMYGDSAAGIYSKTINDGSASSFIGVCPGAY